MTLVVILAGVMAFQAWSAYRHLHRAETLLGDLREHTLAGDSAAGDAALSRLQEEASGAHDSLSGPHWALASHLPVAGDDIGAARTVSSGMDKLSVYALPHLLSAIDVAYSDVGSLRGGKVNLRGIAEAAPHLAQALPALREVDRRNTSISQRELRAGLRKPVTRFVDTVSSVHRGAAAATTAVEVLPSMLGTESPRTYLILNQNTAEQRVLGGIPGSILLARASKGNVRLVSAHAASDVGKFEKPVVRLTDAERTLHGTVLAQYMSNVTDVPDFARGASIARTMWAKRYGQQVDGVIATDPYALQAILAAIGPVKVGDGPTLTGGNAAQVLLNQTYFDHPDPAAQDAFFAEAAQAVFDKLTSGPRDPQALVSALSQSVAQGRMLVWSSEKKAQRALGRFRIGGRWPVEQPPQVGVFVHDRTQSKMSWYQHSSVRVACMPDVGAFRAKVTVRSTAPADSATLPVSVTGNGDRIARGSMWTQVLLSAPPGWTIKDWQASDGQEGVAMMRANGSWTATRDFRLAPGESGTIEFTLQPEEPVADVGIRMTPGATPEHTSIRTSGCTK